MVQNSFKYFPEFLGMQRGTSQALSSAIHYRNPKTSFIYREREEGSARGANEQRDRLAGTSVRWVGLTNKSNVSLANSARTSRREPAMWHSNPFRSSRTRNCSIPGARLSASNARRETPVLWRHVGFSAHTRQPQGDNAQPCPNRRKEGTDRDRLSASGIDLTAGTALASLAALARPGTVRLKPPFFLLPVKQLKRSSGLPRLLRRRA